MHLMTSIFYTAAAMIPGIVVVGSISYMLLILAAAAWPPRKKASSPAGDQKDGPRFVVLIPAHDEEPVLAATLLSLQAQTYSADRYEVVVVADNCTDATAAIARDHGGTVFERTDREKRGKGYALEWAMERLLAREQTADAFLIVDADTWVAPDFLMEAAGRLAGGADAAGRCALQGRYGVLNGDGGWRAALMAAAFELFNHIKPLGRDRLGLSVSLRGNGMVFSRALMEQARWRGDSVTEDIDFGLDLAQYHGVRVGYLPAARVLAQMPVTAEQARSQRERWEGGRYRLIRERAIPLLIESVRRRRPALCDAALNLLLLPLVEIGILWLLWSGLIAAGIHWRLLPIPAAWAALAALSGLGLLAYVLGGLRLAGAPREAYSALLRAPFYAAWKMLLYLRQFGRGRAATPEQEWVRTPRIPVTAETPGTPHEGKAA
jgi:glycosyltransferase involved in cell wall biosynthesis